MGTNWNPGQPDDFRGAEDYVGMWPHGTWNDFSAESRTRETFCIRPFRESTPQVAPKSMFEEATWIWSALENAEEANLKNATENLVVQMASSGYYSCLREADCIRGRVGRSGNITVTIGQRARIFPWKHCQVQPRRILFHLNQKQQLLKQGTKGKIHCNHLTLY